MTISPGSPLIVHSKQLLSKYNSGAKIGRYLDLLEQENKKFNLVSRETTHRDLEKLAAESLVPFEILTKRKYQNYLDIGSGGGLPSFPIMLSFEIQNPVLIERTKKKSVALRRFALDLGLSAKVLSQNLDESKLNQKFDLITLRLVRLSKNLLGQIEDLLAPDGSFVYFARFDETLKNPGLKYSSYPFTTGHDSPIKSFTIFTR